MTTQELIDDLRTKSLQSDKCTLEIMDLCMEAAERLEHLDGHAYSGATCEWYQCESRRYVWWCSGCGGTHVITPYPNPEHYPYKHCPSCGAKITAVNEVEDGAAEDDWGYMRTEL